VEVRTAFRDSRFNNVFSGAASLRNEAILNVNKTVGKLASMERRENQKD